MWPLVPALYISSCHVPPVDTTRRAGAYGGRQWITASRVAAHHRPNLLRSDARTPPPVSLRLSHYKTNIKNVKNYFRWHSEAYRLEECLMSKSWWAIFVLPCRVICQPVYCSSNAQCLSSKASSKATDSPVNDHLGCSLERSHFWSQRFLYSVSNSKQMMTCLLLLKDNSSLL